MREGGREEEEGESEQSLPLRRDSPKTRMCKSLLMWISSNTASTCQGRRPLDYTALGELGTVHIVDT